MVSEYAFIIQVEIVVPDLFWSLPVTHLLPVPKSIVKRRIQMIIFSADFYDIPGMTVFDSFLRIIPAHCDHTPDSERIAQYFHRFCNSLTDSDTLSKRSDDLMGIWLF